MTTLSVLAQYMHDGDNMDGGWGWAMFVLMAIAVVTVVALVVWVVRTTAIHPHGAANQTETPRQVLDRRLAAGEITPDEYHERATILDKSK